MTNRLYNGALVAGMLMPLVYFLNLLIFGFIYPDFSHISQAPSDLGADDAPYSFSSVFNLALILSGCCGIAGAIAISRFFLMRGLSPMHAITCGLIPVLPCWSLIQSGIFPLPSVYHATMPLLLLGIFTPITGAWALAKFTGTFNARVVLILLFICSLSTVAVILGVGDLISLENLGIYIRLWALFSFPSISILCWKVRTLTLDPRDTQGSC